MKKFIFLFLLGFLFIPGSILAQDDSLLVEETILVEEEQEAIIEGTEIEITSHNTEGSGEEVALQEEVTNEDLQVNDPSLLPTSPFYFFKEVGRGLERALTFNSIKKAELELRIASEKAAEAKKVAAQDPNNERGISRALANFQRGQERLRERLSLLSETSENPNIDTLLNKIAERTIVHEKLLQSIEAGNKAQKNVVDNIRVKIQDTFGQIAENDTPEKFQERLQNAFENSRGSTLKHIRSVEILDRLRESDQIPDNVKDRLRELRDNFSDRARGSMERFIEEGENGSDRLRDALGAVPGDALQRSITLEEIRTRASDRAAGVLGEARDSLDETIHDSEELAARVKEQIEKSEHELQRIETKLRENDKEIPHVITSLINQAKEHLTKAKNALDEGNPRNAFGLARAADSIITNILRLIEKGVDFIQRTPEELNRILDRVNLVPVIPGRTGISDKPVDGTDSTGNGITGNRINCLVYDPVCGTDGNTYTCGAVEARSAGVGVVYKGECRNTTILPCPSIDLPSFTRDCNAKSGEIVTDQNHRCGPTPVCRVPNPLRELNVTDLPSSVLPAPQAFSIKADDNTLSPSEIRVKKGAKVKITFNVSSDNVYFAGLDFRSSQFDTGSIDPGGSVVVEFTADQSFEFKSYWPASGVLKATGKVIVE